MLIASITTSESKTRSINGKLYFVIMTCVGAGDFQFFHHNALSTLSFHEEICKIVCSQARIYDCNKHNKD